ncbi:MAG: ABC transporter ATP-binding protein [Massilibacteroides sp.]|nr:ABC transporter ATP-binding protein [Massilibacteroides sp.]MDD3062401.1 ABC transporter ATP-binding protein [Massilibacteroides sp.]MDD4115683.1 ABC transporter ATP-binding protein [Massilibacteroides sp.]MDD4660701.1 ABC transporter ATP-binding protein [Massilibacteroides sp.]
MIRVENLYKIFRAEEVETTAVNAVSLHIRPGEFVAIMGPSGCGKSTLLNVLGLLDSPTSGQYFLDGTEVGHLKESKRVEFRKGKIGFVFQSFNLIEEMDVFENVELPLVYMNIKPPERKRRVEETLQKLNLTHRANHFPNQLSGGQQQRVAIARAIVTHPLLILADEPTGNLDSQNRQDVMKRLLALNQEGITIVMVTHSRNDASFAQRVINLFDGRIVTDIKNYL